MSNGGVYFCSWSTPTWRILVTGIVIDHGNHYLITGHALVKTYHHETTFQ